MKNVILSIASISFIIVIGAGAYEHLTMIPKWSAEPPVSLGMFQGRYGIDPGAFWMPIHPITLLLLIASLVLNRNTARRKSILMVIGGYVAILAATFVYFVPELLTIIRTPFEQTANTDLQSRASLWENLSLVRLVILMSLAYVLVASLTKPLAKA
jgi:hypothetical protein